MAVKSFSISAAVSYGWKTATSNLSFFVVVLLIVLAASALPGVVAGLLDSERATLAGFIVRLLGWGLQIAVSVGLINVSLRIYDRKKTAIKNLFDYLPLIIPYFLGTVIYCLIVLGGIILLVIPGIIWSIKFRYFSYFMVDRGLGPIDALRESAKITRGVKWKLFFLGIVLGLINLAGALTLGIGLFVTTPLSMMAETYAYRKLATK